MLVRVALFALVIAVAACDSAPGVQDDRSGRHQGLDGRGQEGHFDVHPTQPQVGDHYVTGRTIIVAGVTEPSQTVSRVTVRLVLEDRTIAELECEYTSVDSSFAVALRIPDDAVAQNGTVDARVVLDASSARSVNDSHEWPVHISRGSDFMPLDVGTSWTYDFESFYDGDGYYGIRIYGDLTWTVSAIRATETPCEARSDSVVYDVEEDLTGFRQLKEGVFGEPEPLTSRRTFQFIEKADSITLVHGFDPRERSRLHIFSSQWTREGVPRHLRADSSVVRVEPEVSTDPLVRDLYYSFEKNVGLRELMEVRKNGVAGFATHHVVLSDYSVGR